MHRPVLVTPPEMLPVSLDEAKLRLRVDFSDDDDVILAFIAAATQHLDGWTGTLGRCLVEQVWRQDFDGFARSLCLPLGPTISVAGVTWRNAAGQISTVSPSSYVLVTDAGGRSSVRFDRDYSFPSDLYEHAALSVTYRAGYATIPAVEAGPGDPPDPPAAPAKTTVPEPIRTGIMLMVANWYENREANASAVSPLPFGLDMLIDPFRIRSI